jgi:hypothetical protein
MQAAELVLVWFLVQPEGRGTTARLQAALVPLLAARGGAAAARAHVAESVASLTAAGDLEAAAKGPLALGPRGRERALRALGIPRLPKGLTWRTVVSKHLPALALELPAEKAPLVASADGLRGALMARSLGRPALPLARARDVLLWKQLGLDSDTAFTLEAVRALLLNRALGTTGKSSRDATALLAAREAKAARADARALRQALLAQLLDLDAAPSPAAPAAAAPAAGEALDAFAARALAAAARGAPGRSGAGRVLISHAWTALGDAGLSLESFKQRLLEAHRARLLTLARADLPDARDVGAVAASELRGPAQSVFHLIVLSAA